MIFPVNVYRVPMGCAVEWVATFAKRDEAVAYAEEFIQGDYTTYLIEDIEFDPMEPQP